MTQNIFAQLAPIRDRGTTWQCEIAEVATLLVLQNSLAILSGETKHLCRETSLGNFAIAESALVKRLDRVVVQAQILAEEVRQCHTHRLVSAGRQRAWIGQKQGCVNGNRLTSCGSNRHAPIRIDRCQTKRLRIRCA